MSSERPDHKVAQSQALALFLTGRVIDQLSVVDGKSGHFPAEL